VLLLLLGYAAAANRRGKSVNTDRMQLDVSAIVNGDDTRTTLMVKNIPNKYSQVISTLVIYINIVLLNHHHRHNHHHHHHHYYYYFIYYRAC